MAHTLAVGDPMTPEVIFRMQEEVPIVEWPYSGYEDFGPPEPPKHRPDEPVDTAKMADDLYRCKQLAYELAYPHRKDTITIPVKVYLDLVKGSIAEARKSTTPRPIGTR